VTTFPAFSIPALLFPFFTLNHLNHSPPLNSAMGVPIIIGRIEKMEKVRYDVDGEEARSEWFLDS
jgi:hypothetical protein